MYIGAIEAHTLGDTYGADEISPLHSERVVKGLAILETKPEEPIKIILNSTGGSTYDGLAIYDAIKRSPCHITIIATGACMSIASVILQAGDVRKMSSNCVMMIHDGTDSGEGSADSVLNWAKIAQVINKKMYLIYSERSGKTTGYWKNKCKEDYILTSEQAIAEGLADEII